MISSCRCYGVPDLLRVPSPSSCGWVLTARGSADTVWFVTLPFARCSSPLGPCFVVCCCFHRSVAAVDTAQCCWYHTQFPLCHSQVDSNTLCHSQVDSTPLCSHSRKRTTPVLKSHEMTLANHTVLTCLPVAILVCLAVL
jgi:hypothetical protein